GQPLQVPTPQFLKTLRPSNNQQGWRSLRIPCAFNFSRSQYSISAMDSRVCSATTLSFALSSEMERFSGFAGIRPVFLRLSFAGSSYHRACTFRTNFSEVLPARLDGFQYLPKRWATGQSFRFTTSYLTDWSC